MGDPPRRRFLSASDAVLDMGDGGKVMFNSVVRHCARSRATGTASDVAYVWKHTHWDCSTRRSPRNV
eukprot:5682040-Alexandrium_andersonii.AAC.1